MAHNQSSQYNFSQTALAKYPHLATISLSAIPHIQGHMVELLDEFFELENYEHYDFFRRVQILGEEKYKREHFKPCKGESNCDTRAAAGALCSCSDNKHLRINWNLVSEFLQRGHNPTPDEMMHVTLAKSQKQQELVFLKQLVDIGRHLRLSPLVSGSLEFIKNELNDELYNKNFF